MNRISRSLALAGLSACAAFAQPVVSSALNNASYAVPGLPNAGLARGSMVAVFGQRLAAEGTQLATEWPLQTSMRGTSARITVGSTTVDALMAYTTPGQIGIVIPSATPDGNGTLTVSYNGTSTPINVQIVRSAFGAFTRNSQGTGAASIENASQTGRPINALNRPARPGEVMVLWGTGLGPVTWNDAQPPQPGDIPGVDVEVWVGGRRANVTYKGRSGCCAGIDQLAFTVPEGVEGCSVPVVVKTGDVVSNFPTMAVARTGNVCSDPALGGADLFSGIGQSGSMRLGTIVLSRTISKIEAAGQTVDSSLDSGFATFMGFDWSNVDLDSAARAANFNTVAFGSCSVTTLQTSSTGTPVTPPMGNFRMLDAGTAINVNGPKGAKQMTRMPNTTGTYMAQLGGGIVIPGLPNIPGMPGAEPPYLDPGAYRFDNGSGGAGPNAVGPFQVTMDLGQPLNWTNMAAVSTITRSAGQEVTWSGGDPSGFVSITGSSFNLNSRVGAIFSCLERASVGRFTIPGYVLSVLPPSTGTGASATGASTLSVGSQSTPKSFTASGLDAGYVMHAVTNTKTVTYR